MNKTQIIMANDCPYENRYQTDATRILFVCSVGMLRSPTAQIIASEMGYNARACGSCIDMALIPISCNLINWAHKICFANKENYRETIDIFEPLLYSPEIKKKHEILGIPDDYNWNDPHLKQIILERLLQLNIPLTTKGSICR